MGKYLQIRVTAWTYNEEAMQAAWPGLTALAWDGRSGSGRHGVLEMVGALDDGLAYAEWPDDVQRRLRPGIQKAVEIKNQLEAALGDWKPSEANRLSEALEDELEDLEVLAPES